MGETGQEQCILKGVLEGKPPLEALLDNCYVDVRDVARAHIAAAELPNATVSNMTVLALSFLRCLVCPLRSNSNRSAMYCIASQSKLTIFPWDSSTFPLLVSFTVSGCVIVIQNIGYCQGISPFVK